jgi:hypothetical protein
MKRLLPLLGLSPATAAAASASASDSTHEPVMGVEGDPTKASAALRRVFLDFKVRDTVA